MSLRETSIELQKPSVIVSEHFQLEKESERLWINGANDQAIAAKLEHQQELIMQSIQRNNDYMQLYKQKESKLHTTAVQFVT